MNKPSRSKINIKESKRGTFTAAARKSGQTVQQKARSVLADPGASPAMRKKAQFAKNVGRRAK